MSRPRKIDVVSNTNIWVVAFCEIKRRLDDEDINGKDYGASQPYNYHIPVSALTHVQHQGYNFTTEMII